jgi:hypothetical protein
MRSRPEACPVVEGTAPAPHTGPPTPNLRDSAPPASLSTPRRHLARRRHRAQSTSGVRRRPGACDVGPRCAQWRACTPSRYALCPHRDRALLRNRAPPAPEPRSRPRTPRPDYTPRRHRAQSGGGVRGRVAVCPVDLGVRGRVAVCPAAAARAPSRDRRAYAPTPHLVHPHPPNRPRTPRPDCTPRRHRAQSGHGVRSRPRACAIGHGVRSQATGAQSGRGVRGRP